MSSPEEILRTSFGHSAFRGFQRQVIERTLSGGHSLVMMPTGGGKSLCFQLPALAWRESMPSSDARSPLTLVLSPLVALMKDQVDALRRRGVDAGMINSLLSRSERESMQARLGQGEFSLLYVTPERFRKGAFLEVIAKRNVRLLAVDEAHCISDWGHDFRPDYSRLCEIRQELGGPTTLALTATATPDVQQDIVRQLGLPGFGETLDHCQRFHSGIERPNLELDVVTVWGDTEKLDHIAEVVGRYPNASGIVYFTLIRSLEAMSEALSERGLEHTVYHGNLDRQQRRRIQNEFMSGETPVVLATNAFGMGIDKEDIRYVVHAEVPNSLEAYYQEVGRAGRDGSPALCRLLYSQDDLLTQMEFLHWSNPDSDFYLRVYDFLLHERDQVRAYGMDWLRQRLCDRHKHDRRLETALAMLHRYGVIEHPTQLEDVAVQDDLPASLADPEAREAKRQRDQKKLYAMVEYVQADDRKAFLGRYFGIGS